MSKWHNKYSGLFNLCDFKYYSCTFDEFYRNKLNHYTINNIAEIFIYAKEYGFLTLLDIIISEYGMELVQKHNEIPEAYFAEKNIFTFSEFFYKEITKYTSNDMNHDRSSINSNTFRFYKEFDKIYAEEKCHIFRGLIPDDVLSYILFPKISVLFDYKNFDDLEYKYKIYRLPNFWFRPNPSLAIPIISLQYSQVEIQFELPEIDELIN